jgi:uncharacterized membrane protein
MAVIEGQQVPGLGAPTGGPLRRGLLILSSVALLASALWFGETWVDSGDNTCGSVFRFSRWTDGQPVTCRAVMPGRSAVVGVAAIFAVVLAVVAVRKTRVSGRWMIAGLAGLGVALLLVVLNPVMSPA